MSVNWGMVGGMVGASLLTALIVWLFTRSARSYADDAMKPALDRIAAVEVALLQRIGAIEKDLLTNYVQHKHLDEMKKLMERLDRSFTRMQIAIASKLKLPIRQIEQESDES